jgi:uncharacterized membrane protein
MEVITHHKHAVNISQTERIVSAIGGGILASAGLIKRSPAGLALALIGGDLLRRGITGHSYAYEAFGIRTAPKGQGAETTSVPYELGIRVDRTVILGRPREEVFRFWRDLGNLPRFMKYLESVTETGGNRSHWVVKAPGGRTVEWDAVIHNEIPNELLAWRSLPGADVENAGTVLFKDAVNGRSATEVRVELQYNPPAGAVGALVASMMGNEPGQQIEEDLNRLVQMFDDGSAWSPARFEGLDQVQAASEASFPASDAPSYNP